MSKVRKQFIIYAMIAVFVLLTVLLIVINGVNYTMVTEDADQITQMIAGDKGAFGEELRKRPRPGAEMDFGRMEFMGPNSPELPFTARYFTFRFDKEGNAEEIAFNIAAFTREEAQTLAEKLKRENTGWVNGIYRYRVYQNNGFTYVTVVDQGREMLPTLRILIISVIGEAAVLGIVLVFLVYISRRLFQPLEEADRKQQKFLAEAKKEFQIPLTVINANAEILEKEHGSSEFTQAIHRQVKKMTALTKQLDSFAMSQKGGQQKASCDLSMILTAATDLAAGRLQAQGIEMKREISSDILIDGDEEAMHSMAAELVENALKFAGTHVSFSLNREGGHVIVCVSNDTELGTGNVEQVFDRFTRLENAENKNGNGLGLSYVKDIVKAHNGRIGAKVENGEFILRIIL